MNRLSLDTIRLHLARGRSKTGRSDTQDKEQLHAVSQQFQEVSRSLGDQILSLRQGRSQNLITQAARHHAAQVNLVLFVLITWILKYVVLLMQALTTFDSFLKFYLYLHLST